MSKPTAAAAAVKSRPKQPASSRQAQEYLQQAAALSSSNAFASNAFAAFGSPFDSTPDTSATATSFSSTSASVSAASSTARLRDSIDSNDTTLNFILRKLTKRDPTTKLKALDELNFHLTAVDPTTIPSLMPALLYALDRLYSDNDRRVREQLQTALATLVDRAKREAFTPPNLRQLFSLWWCWQHDSVREVSRRSRAVWKTLLPTDDKERQALRFVHSAYFAHTTTLLTCTVESLSDMAVTSVEAAQERYDRLVAAAVTGLLTWMQRLTADDNKQYQSDYDRLLDLALPLLQSPRPLVRRAMYALLTGLMSQQREWMERQLQHLSPLLLDVVSERDKTNHAAMWDLLLHFLQSFPTCFDFLPPEPQRYRQLLLAIEKAGYGSSVLLWSHLLPLLSTIPTTATSPAFYHSFFTALFASRLSLDQPSAVVSSSTRDLTPLFNAYLECTIYVIIRNRHTAPAIATAVLYDELLDVLWRELSGEGSASEEDGRDKLWMQAGKNMAVIERYLQRDADEGKVQQQQQQTGNGLTVDALYFRLQEMCKMGMERAERDDKLAAQDGNVTRRKKSVWKCVEEFVCAMQQERLAQKAKAADTPAPSPSSSSSVGSTPLSSGDPLASLASTLFLMALRSFAQTMSLSPIHLAQSLASSFTINTLLASSSPPTSPSAFLATDLLPIFRTLLSQPAERGDEYAVTVDSYLALLGETLRVCGYSEAQLSDAQRKELDELLTALASSSPLSETTSTTSTLSLPQYLTFIHSFLTHVLTRLPHFTAHPTLDDEALSLAESLLTTESSASSTRFVGCMTLLLPLLSPATAYGVISSFVEALSSFLAMATPFAPIDVDSSEFTTASGATVASLPSVLQILTPYINKPRSALAASSSDAADGDWQSLHSTLLSTLFFLQSSSYPTVASVSKQSWLSVPAAALEEPSTVLSSIANTFHTALLTAPLASLTSAFILGWSHQAALLTSSFRAILSSLLPSHGELTDTMRGSSEQQQERVRVIRDCISELMRELGQAAVLNKREWLLIDLLAIELHFRWHTRTSQQLDADTLLDSLAAFVVSLSKEASSAAMLTTLFQQAMEASSQSGAPYSDALRWLIQLAEKNEMQLTADLPQLLVKTLLLPLAGQGGSSKLPAAFSSLLAPLASSMPKTLTRNTRQTLVAVLSSSAAYAPLSSSTAPAADSLVPHLDVLARAAANEVERVSKRGGKDDAELAYIASLLAIVAAIVHHAPVVPAWLKQRAFGLLSSLPAPPASTTQSCIDYLQGRAELCEAVWLRLEGKLSALPAVMIKSLVTVAAGSLQHALTQSRAKAESSATAYAYLPPVIAFLHSALPSLVSSASSLSLDLLPIIRSCYQLLASPLLATTLSVTQYEETLTQLAGLVVYYLEHVTDALNLLLSADFAEFSHTFALSPSSPPPFTSTTPLSHFFALLSHPFPSLALAVHQLLSIALLYRAVSAVVDEDEEESLAVVKSSLSDDEGGAASEDRIGGSGETDEEQERKEARRRRRRIVRERQRLRERISLLLPPQLQALLEGHLQTDDTTATTVTAASTSSPYLFANRPLALQLCGHLLVLSLVLNLHDHVLPLSSSSLSTGKRTLLLSYLRDFDAASPFLSELIEHIAVAATPQLISTTLSQASGPLIIPLALRMLVPTAAVNDDQRLLSSWRRSHQLAQLHAVLSYVDDACFYPALCCMLYLRVLHVLPVLARAWWTNVDRQASATVQRITASHFSPLLIAHELSAVSTMPPPKPADPDSESELTVSAITSSSTVSARYVKDEIQLTLLLRLSSVHPLTPPVVDLTSDSLRIAPQLLKRWQLQVTSALLSSSRSLGAAVEGWYVNVDGHLSGVEECPICYSVVHGVHGVLPRMRCAQCGKRYHNVCLYTWFEKSGHSSCPLCRGSF